MSIAYKYIYKITHFLKKIYNIFFFFFCVSLGGCQTAPSNQMTIG